MIYKIDGKRVSIEEWYKAQDGLCQSFYKNGQLEYSYTYLYGETHGEPHGICQHFYDNGQLASSFSFVNGRRHGLFQYFHKDGQLSSLELYVNEEGRPDLMGEDMKMARLVIFGHDPMEKE